MQFWRRFPYTPFGRSELARSPSYGIGDLRGDVLGGISAGVVSLPIAMGFGILSGLARPRDSTARSRRRWSLPSLAEREV